MREAWRNGLYLLAAWLTALIYTISGQIADVDLWGRLSIAALYFQNGVFPYRDVFSYTANGAPWTDHEWLTGFTFYQILIHTGETGFLLFKRVLLLLVFYLLFRLHRKVYQVSAMYTLYGLLLLVPVYSFGWFATLRAQVFSFLFFTAFLLVLEKIRLGRLNPRFIWWLVPAGVIWANFHGGFIVGLLLLILYGVGAALKARTPKAGLLPVMVAGVTVILTGLFNPYGFAYLNFLMQAWTLDRSFIPEWQPLWVSAQFWPAWVLVGVVLVVIALNWVNARSADKEVSEESVGGNLITPTLVLLWLLFMAVKGIRFQTFLALAAVAYAPLFLPPGFLGRYLPGFFWRLLQKEASAFRNTLPLLLLLSALGGIIFLGLHGTVFRLPLADEMTHQASGFRYPLGAVNFLRNSPWQGNLMVRFGLGQFAYWMLYPRFKVSMDGRYEEVYSQKQFLWNQAFFKADTPGEIHRAIQEVTDSPADFILTEVTAPHAASLGESQAWRTVYADEYFMLLGRVSTLQKYPEYQPQGFLLTTKLVTIQDLVQPEELQRFKAAGQE